MQRRIAVRAKDALTPRRSLRRSSARVVPGRISPRHAPLRSPTRSPRRAPRRRRPEPALVVDFVPAVVH